MFVSVSPYIAFLVIAVVGITLYTHNLAQPMGVFILPVLVHFTSFSNLIVLSIFSIYI